MHAKPFKIEYTYAKWPNMDNYEVMRSSHANIPSPIIHDIDLILPERIFTMMEEMTFEETDFCVVGDIEMDGEIRPLNEQEKDWLAAFILRDLEEENAKVLEDLMNCQAEKMPNLIRLIPSIIKHRSNEEQIIYMQKIKNYYMVKLKHIPPYFDAMNEISI